MTKNIRGVSGVLAALALCCLALPAFSQPVYSTQFLTDVPGGSRGRVSGPEVGERIPDFEAYDQNGALVSLQDVMGPNGAMVVFHRSADW